VRPSKKVTSSPATTDVADVLKEWTKK